MVELIPDTEWAIREWLRTELAGIKSWFGTPKGSPSYPYIEIVGRIGGAPDVYTPLDNPRVSFACWGGPGGGGRELAVNAMRDLVELIHDTEATLLDPETFGYTGTVDSILWTPDDSDPDNSLARYIVDATFAVRSS